MAKFQNTNGYSFSWTQDYTGWTVPLIYCHQVNMDNELARLDFIEQQVQEMESFPEVEALLERIMK